LDDIKRLSHSNPLPLASVPPNQRVIIIIHCAPKMGSLTLRHACRKNLIDSCGSQQSWLLEAAEKAKVDPIGYWNVTKFGELIHGCNDTHHFCLRKGTFTDEVERFKNTVFLHLYPFRNYDEWTISALKEPFRKIRQRGCNSLSALMDKCKDKHGELSFWKYPKVRMSEELQPLVSHRINEMRELHRILLYPYGEIDGLLTVLSKAYQLPLLPGSNGTSHAKLRQNGTCDQSILDTYHKCFTSKLTELSWGLGFDVSPRSEVGFLIETGPKRWYGKIDKCHV